MRAAVLFCLLAAAGAHAQAPGSAGTPADTLARSPAPSTSATDSAAPSLDGRLLRAVYHADAPPFVAVMRGVNGAAYPVFAAAAPVAAGIAVARGTEYRPAARIFLSEAGTTIVVFALKRLVRRPRPYRTMPGIVARDSHHAGDATGDPYSFPSGHAAIAFAIATSATLSDARLAAPAYLWATAVAASRVWHGVHYPSDVLVGAAIGAGSAFVVHTLIPLPAPGGSDAVPRAALPVRIVVPF